MTTELGEIHNESIDRATELRNQVYSFAVEGEYVGISLFRCQFLALTQVCCLIRSGFQPQYLQHTWAEMRHYELGNFIEAFFTPWKPYNPSSKLRGKIAVRMLYSELLGKE